MQLTLLTRTKIIAIVVSLAIAALGVSAAGAAGAQVFNVYDNTQDGLQAGTDPDIGNVQVVANPGGQSRLIINVHVQKAAPNCTLTVELVRDDAASNGGLDETGHSGSIQTLGTLTTNRVGNGNAHFDIDPSADGVPDTLVYGHIDLEDSPEDCGLALNQYGAAPDPALGTPLTWLE